MNRFISVILTTIILMNFCAVNGSLTALENALKSLNDAREKKQLAFVEPTSYYPCNAEALLRAEKAFKTASKSVSNFSENAPQDLSTASCEYNSSNGYHWAKLTYTTEENKICTKIVIFKWITPKDKKNVRNILEFQDDFTFQANQGLKCEDAIVNDSKIQIDDEVIIQEEVAQVDVEPVEQKVIQEKIVSDNVNVIEEALTFGPQHTHLAAHPQNDKVGSNERAPLSVDEDVVAEESAPENHIKPETSNTSQLVGSWKLCGDSEVQNVKSVFAILIGQKKVSAVYITNQNVRECRKQLVNGMNYSVLLSFDNVPCQIAFNEAFNGLISLSNTAPKYDNAKECTEVYSPSQ